MRQLENKKSSFLNVLGPYSLAFALAAIFSLGIFVIRKKTFLTYDSIAEYVTCLAYWGNYLRSAIGGFLDGGKLAFPQWDFTVGLGADILTTLHWYVIGDPVTLLAAFVKPEHSVALYHFIVLLRLYLSGLFFILWCRQMGLKPDYLVHGAIMYIFCGYAFYVCIKHSYFMNLFMYLPLLYIGLEKILHDESPIPFVIFVLLAAITNFYFFYILTILIFVYALVRFSFIFKGQVAKNLPKYFLSTVLFYMIGLLCASFIFYPNIAGFFSTNRSSLDIPVGIFYPILYYVKIFLATISTANIASYTFLGFAPIFLPMALLAIFRKSENLRQIKVFAVIYILFLCFPLVGHIFNGFNYVTNRWSFVCAFIAGWLAVEMLPQITKMTGREMVLTLGSSSILALMVFAASAFNEDLRTGYFVPYACLLLTNVILFVLNKKDFSQKIVKSSLMALILVTVGLNACVQYADWGRGYLSEKFFDWGYPKMAFFNSAENMIDTVTDSDFYRYNSRGRFLTNMSTFKHKRGTAFYWSENNGYIMDFLDKNGVLGSGLQYNSDFDGRIALDSLAAVKYGIYENPISFQPYNFEPVSKGEFNGKAFELYKNSLPMPFAFTYSKRISKEDFDLLPIAQKQEVFLSAFVLNDFEVADANGDFEKSFPAEKVSLDTQELDSDLSFDPSIKSSGESSFKISDKKQKIHISFTGLPDAENYVVIEDLYYGKGSDGSSMTLTGQLGGENFSRYFEIPQFYIKSNHSCLINLGRLENKKYEFDLTFEKTGHYSFKKIRVEALPLANVNEKLATLKAESLENVKIGPDIVSGEISLESPKFLFLSMPYSKGWKAYVDGKKADLYRTQIMYSGLPLEKGSHSIELRYFNPDFKIGICLSLVGLALFVMLFVFRKLGLLR